jgi:signal transduction histidine kinase
MPSLRNKILHTYAFSKLVLLAFAVVVFLDLRYLYGQIEAGRTIIDFRESVLEMRRDEKNLFLFGDLSSLDHLIAQTDAAADALTRDAAAFRAVGGGDWPMRIGALLSDYRTAVLGYPLLPERDETSARQHIRALGHELTEASDALSGDERRRLAEATRRAGAMLLFAFVGVVGLGIGGGLFLAHRVLRPLRGLQSGLVAIDEGRSQSLALPSRDQEIVSFVAAFNAMLKHMRQQQDQARRKEKAAALGVLVSGVAHELNNPLSNISTSVQLLIEEGDAVDHDTRAHWLAQIDGETERARRIVRRLLNSVRQRAPHLRPECLTELIRGALALAHGQLPAGVAVCVAANADLTIRVDRDRLQQALINLIRNAADAGARHITLGATLDRWQPALAEDGHLEGDPAMLTQGKQAVCISVADDGPGIAAEVRDRLFEPFVTTRADGEGTGLGLYLVAEIVGEHRGCIVVHTGYGVGSRFDIWLPLEEENT